MSKPDSTFPVELIERLCRLVDRSKLRELEFHDDCMHLRLVKSRLSTRIEYPVDAVATSSQEAKCTALEPVDSQTAEPPHLRVIANMTGTFYRASDPGAKPFVQVGDLLQVGQSVGIIEAMKMLNEVESELAGRVIRVLVDDGCSVVPGTPLLELEAKGNV